jgi:translation initiation factor 2 beta subunit (eIF-2beta)/eIF-5
MMAGTILEQLAQGGNGHGATTEAAARLRAPRMVGGRKWEKEHRPFSYRIPEELNAALKQVVEYYQKEMGLRTNLGFVAEAVIRAGLAEWDKGKVEVRVVREEPARAVRG